MANKDGVVHFRAELAAVRRLERLAARHGEIKAAGFARMAFLRGLPLVEQEFGAGEKAVRRQGGGRRE